MSGTDWSEDAIARLRALWDERHPAAEIGRRLRVSKNAVIGKAHRLHLPPRRGPTRRNEGESQGEPRAAKPAKSRGPTLPPPRPAAAKPSPPPTMRPAPVPARCPVPAPLARPVHVPSSQPCCWPIGEPGRPGFRFCGEGTAPGKPYCPAHAEAAYVRPKTAHDRPDCTRLTRTA